MSDERTDEELVRRAKLGDQDAFGALMLRHHPRLELLVQARLGSRLKGKVGLEDVLQEVYIRAFVGIDRFAWRRPGGLKRWLENITEHVICDQARLYSRKCRTDPLEALRRESGDPEPRPEVSRVAERTAAEAYAHNDRSHWGEPTSPSRRLRREERLGRLTRAIENLTPEHREVVILARIRELPIKDIAERMDRSPNAVSMLLIRAVEALRNHFGEETESLGLPKKNVEHDLDSCLKPVTTMNRFEMTSGVDSSFDDSFNDVAGERREDLDARDSGASLKHIPTERDAPPLGTGSCGTGSCGTGSCGTGSCGTGSYGWDSYGDANVASSWSET